GQALAVAGAAAAVRAQARQLLSRLPGRTHEDLLVVLDAEPRERWATVLREEVLRIVDLPVRQRSVIVEGFLDGALARPGASYDLVESLLQVVIELPPGGYGLLVGAIEDACADRPGQDTERLRAVIASVMARFALPQWQRLAASLNAVAQEAGRPATWT
ncbi:MAG: hypothetical protein M3419_01415, partial [Actinomycetota bacterium]|nr:hypothetical protein [Actinomycetota bacterium]